jgi:DedD protein
MPNDAIAEQVEVRRKGRQRLIGAIVLALLAVVFVPMLLDPEPRSDRAEPLLAIPPREGAAPLAAVTPAPEPAQGAKPEVAPPEAARPEAAKPGAEAPSPPPAAVAPKPEAKVLAPAAPPPRAATAAKPETRAAAAAPKLEGFAVQVGAFREEAKLAQAREKVVAARVPHYTERLDSASGELTRLRAGPFPTREVADKAAAQLKRAGLDVRVVPLP